jgi:hypothetical protein
MRAAVAMVDDIASDNPHHLPPAGENFVKKNDYPENYRPLGAEIIPGRPSGVYSFTV